MVTLTHERAYQSVPMSMYQMSRGGYGTAARSIRRSCSWDIAEIHVNVHASRAFSQLVSNPWCYTHACGLTHSPWVLSHCETAGLRSCYTARRCLSHLSKHDHFWARHAAWSGRYHLTPTSSRSMSPRSGLTRGSCRSGFWILCSTLDVDSSLPRSSIHALSSRAVRCSRLPASALSLSCITALQSTAAVSKRETNELMLALSRVSKSVQVNLLSTFSAYWLHAKFSTDAAALSDMQPTTKRERQTTPFASALD